MPVSYQANRTELERYQHIADEQSFRLDGGNMFDNLMVAEAVAVHPDQCPEHFPPLVTAHVSSVPSAGNDSYSCLMKCEHLAGPTDLKKLFWMAGDGEDTESHYVYVVYLTARRKYLRKVKVTPEGVAVPIPVSLAVFNVKAARDGYLNLPIPVKDRIAFDGNLKELDIIEHVGDALKARIIVFHDLNEAVLQLMSYANHDRNEGLNGWVADWLNTVQNKLDADRDAKLAEIKRKQEYESFIQTLPPSPVASSDTWTGFKEKAQRYIAIVLGSVAGFALGHFLLNAFAG